MDKEKGIGYCGLSCALCSGNKNCPGCRNEGCPKMSWCKNYTCARQKKLKGCWECEKFPCDTIMFNKLKIRSFAKFIKLHGEEKMLERLAQNEHDGIIYHYPEQIVGDYDELKNEDEIFDMLLNGRKL